MSVSTWWGRLMARLIVGPALRYDMDQALRELGQGNIDGGRLAAGFEADKAMSERMATALKRIRYGR